MKELVLASSSPYRQAQLAQLGLPFATAEPRIDETARPGEKPSALASRLAEAKARAVAPQFPAALIIGSDQVASLDGQLLGKPGTVERAREQLLAASDRWMQFHTGLCLLDAGSGCYLTTVVPFRVRLRQLKLDQINAYLTREAPLDCAGAFKAEGLGIALLAEMVGSDPNALIGLPLIALCNQLADFGVDVVSTIQ
jgi:septum formation protein